MNSRKTLIVVAVAVALTAGAFTFVLARPLAPPPAGSPVPRVITYEGNLDQNGQPAPDGAYSFAFSFWNDLTATTPANQVGTTISKNGVQVTGGKFIVELAVDDDTVYETNPLYLEITVNSNKLAPRQKINSSTFAVRAEKAEMAASLGQVVPASVVVTAGGKVGIGTATPAVNLDVAGDAKVSGVFYSGCEIVNGPQSDAATTNVTVTAHCPVGKIVVGGGGWCSSTSHSPTNSYPSTRDSWEANFNRPVATYCAATAICCRFGN